MTYRNLARATAAAIAIVLAVGTPPAARGAIVICKRKKTIKLREDACKRKETQLDAADLGITGPTGEPGTPGAPGAPGTPGTPGELRIYGDGSAGSLTIDEFKLLSDLVPDGNLQFTTVTIAAGGELVVPSGTVIRCSESFINNGTITVEQGTDPGELSVLSPTSQVIPRSRAAHPGVTGSPARGPGATVNGTGWEAGASAGLFDSARWILRPGPYGGGGGFLGPRGGGGAGGGSFTVLAMQGITNAGTIEADGQDGSSTGAGGGGGGFVVLASPTMILHTAAATVSVHGGDGGGAGDATAIGALPEFTAGPGGGGGGGCVHLLAPTVTNAGAVGLTGGSAGSANTVTLRSLRVGGAGGGASCGSGGGGGRITGSTTPGAADAGSDGRLFVTLADPTGML